MLYSDESAVYKVSKISPTFFSHNITINNIIINQQYISAVKSIKICINMYDEIELNQF